MLVAGRITLRLRKCTLLMNGYSSVPGTATWAENDPVDSAFYYTGNKPRE